jgi:hypothetical protein
MLMRVIDELKPELMASLHNAGFGGVYYYLSRGAEPLYQTLHELPEWEGLPLSLGEAEVPYAEPLAPAIYPMISIKEGYDYIEKNGGDPLRNPSGTSSADYAAPYGTFSVVTEVAYFDDPRCNDQTPTETLRRDSFLQSLELKREGGETLGGYFKAVEKQLKGQSPFQVSVEWWASLSENREAELNWAKTDPSMERPATVAELFSNHEQTQFYRLLGLGMYLRMLEGEIAIGNGTPTIRQCLADAAKTFDEWCGKLESTLDMRAVPIRKLVAVQLGAILACGDYLARERKGSQ